MQLYNGHHHLGMFVNFGGTLITVVIQMGKESFNNDDPDDSTSDFMKC